MNYVSIFATADNRVKARSRRGWTAPTPADIAKAEATKRAAEREEAKREQQRLNRLKHYDWLFTKAASLPPGEQLDWLAQNASPVETTMIMDRIAKAADAQGSQ